MSTSIAEPPPHVPTLSDLTALAADVAQLRRQVDAIGALLGSTSESTEPASPQQVAAGEPRGIGW